MLAPRSTTAAENASRLFLDARLTAMQVGDSPSPFLQQNLLASWSCRTKGRKGLPLILLASLCLLASVMPAAGSEQAMKGPAAATPRHRDHLSASETSVVRLVLLGAIDLYRKGISPVRGLRCGFYPSCSDFGRQAVGRYGVLHGTAMTADRLIRCNAFREAGPDYYPLPDGRLFDPVSNNAMNQSR